MESPSSEEKKSFKTFSLTEFSLKNRTSVGLFTFIIIVFGLLSYFAMPKELFPELKMPQIYVRTVYPGNSPSDIENLITRPIEKEINAVDGIKTLSSTSVQDNSAIFVEFNMDVDVDEALSDVKDAVDKAKSELPTDLDMDPIVMDIDFSEFPILNINLSGDFSLDDLKDYAEYLEDQIEEFDEIRRVDLKGALEREVTVSIDLPRLEAVQLSMQDIENAISMENLSMSGGDVKIGDTRRTVRLMGEFTEVDQIGDIVVKHENERLVYLKEVATVIDSYKERNSYARLDGFPVISLDVIKKSGENLLSVTDKILDAVNKAKEDRFPENLKITITNDQSEQTRNQISNLENSIIMGVILVVLVLLFFMGVRNSLFVGLAIPMSMFLSFAVMGVMGISINMVVLFGLILALGMLVDNAIVVVENIYRLYEQGMPPLKAASKGVGEVAIPIIASTATTLAAFFPLLFWNDLMGEFMKYIPMTLIIVLASSLFVALIINPVFTAKYMRLDDYNRKPNWRKIFRNTGIMTVIGILIILAGGQIFGWLIITLAILVIVNAAFFKPASHWFQTKPLVKLEQKYEQVLRYWLKGRRPAVLTFVWMPLLMIFSIILLIVRSPQVHFFPVNEPKYINVFIETALGTDITSTDSIVKVIEEKVFAITQQDTAIITSIVTNVGEGSNDPNDGPSQGETPNKGRITITFEEYQLRDGRSTSEVMKRLSDQLVGFPGVIISVDKNREGPPVGKPINIEVIGEDFTTLLQEAEELMTIIERENIPGIEGLELDLEIGKPELLVQIDRTKARMFGLSTATIGSTLRNALLGKEVSKFKDGEDEHPIYMRLEDRYRYNVSSLLNQLITFRDATTGKIQQVPISAVAEIKYSSTYGSIKRKNLDRVVTVSSNVISGYNPTEINNQIKELLSSHNLPEGYTFKFTGEQEEQAKSMAFLSNALLIAVALIALILVSQFNSVIKPFIIIITVVFSTIGVFVGLSVFNMDFVVIMTGIGIVSLAGIVVNNAIVLIDYTDLVRQRMRESHNVPEGEFLSIEQATDAIVEAGKTRLRPVMLTAITTVLGLFPLATGMNFDFTGLYTSFNPNIYFGGDNAIFWGPMAWTVIFGLTFATFLTLVLVPSMYLLSDRVIRYTKGLKKRS